MFDVLAAQRLLVLMIVIGLGGLCGQIPFGPLRFGAAGALLMGLVVGALDPRFGQGLGPLKALGVVLFCYTVGLGAGTTFVADLRRQWGLMLAGVVGLGAMAGAGVLLARPAGLSPEHVAGLYAGVLTSPAIDAALAATGGAEETLVGYALAYPTGVVVGMIAVAWLVGRHWPGTGDTPSMAEEGLVATSVRVEREVTLAEIPGWTQQRVKLSYLERDGRMRVVRPSDALRLDDRALVIGTPDDVATAVAFLGHESSGAELTADRREVDFRRFVVSNSARVGRTIAELNVAGRLHGVITRVRRGDVDLLARDDLVLQPGDRVLAVVPRSMLEGAESFFGDSERRVSQVDAFTLGLGIALGVAVGLVTVPLPGGLSFGLGLAAGPPVVGMVLGGLHRTGPFRWDLPHAVNATIRQIGLMVFLAAIGLASGPAFLRQAATLTGVATVAVAAGTVLLGAGVLVAVARLQRLSAPRTAGALAGFIGQPALLAYANSRTNDERIDSAYGALFALGTVVKILLVQLIALA